MYLTVNRNKNQIIGYSLSHENSILSILNIKENNSKINFLEISKNEKWAGMDMLTDEDLLIVASTLSKPAGTSLVLQSFEVLEDGIKLFESQTFTQRNFNSAQFMKKIKGYDYFVIASKSNLGIVGYFEGEFELIKIFEDVYSNYIFEISIFGNFMIPVCLDQESNFKVIEFNTEDIESTLESMKMKSSLKSLVEEEKKVNKDSQFQFDFNIINDTYAHLSKILENDPIVRKFQTPQMSKFIFF